MCCCSYLIGEAIQIQRIEKHVKNYLEKQRGAFLFWAGLTQEACTEEQITLCIHSEGRLWLSWIPFTDYSFFSLHDNLLGYISGFLCGAEETQPAQSRTV